MFNNTVTILAIETSCDETSVAVIVNGSKILSNIIYSQIDIHKLYGGVVPEIASRNHVNKISETVDKALEESGLTFEDITAIAVTQGPGLEGALLVGVSYAKALAFSLKKPLIPIHHIEGHISANYLNSPDITFPFISLIVSGGHTQLVKVTDYGKYEVLGKTRDDAVGEAYDKVARVLNLEYPGGPKIDNLAKIGNKEAINFPRVYLDKNSLEFSFSGIKSAVLNYINSCKMKEIEIVPEDVAASFQAAVLEVLVNKTILCCKNENINQLVLSGGVASNNGLRELIKIECDKNNIKLNIPPPVFCTDNAAMIGACAYYHYINEDFADMSLNAVPNLKLKSL